MEFTPNFLGFSLDLTFPQIDTKLKVAIEYNILYPFDGKKNEHKNL